MTACALCLLAASAHATPFSFTTGGPDGLIATTSRPSGGGLIETETADDFILSSNTSINHATFTGLLTNGASLANVSNIAVEIYRVFPLDSTVPPSGNVPTRANSPSDVALDTRDIAGGTLNFTALVLGPFSAGNSVLNGINPLPNTTTLGEGPVTGTEVRFDVTFTTPFVLPADHYFFVPQVQVNGGDFLWLSAQKPNLGNPITPDLQTWIRNETLSPNWLRVGTDIIGGTPAPTFNASFSLSGEIVPEPSTLLLFGGGLAMLLVSMRKGRVFAA